MTRARGTVRLGVGTCVYMRGIKVDIVELTGNRVVLRDGSGHFCTASVAEVTQDLQQQTQAVDPEPMKADSLDNPEVSEKLAHVREIETGYKSGSPLMVEPGEPRPEYLTSKSRVSRCQAKAVELGIAKRTVQRWVKLFRESGAAGLVDERTTLQFETFAGIDPRWLDVARQIIDEHELESTPTKQLVLDRIRARLDREHGDGVVQCPRRSKAYRALSELNRGTNAFTGSAKGKRSIANKPTATFSGLKATSPMQYVLFDTTPLDVFAMDPITMSWVGIEMTIAIDLYSRCIVGLRMSPRSTKAIDVARVLHNILEPTQFPRDWPPTARWPYGGIPAAVVFDPTRVTTAGTPSYPDTVIVDHGRQYVSQHFMAACERLGISIQPARPYTPTDKAVVERFFRTLRQGLIEALPGYKGPDVFSRGERPEQDAFFFMDELEEIVREWIATVYHLRPHSSLVDPHVPGMNLSPAQMFDHGISRCGFLEVPADPNLAKQLLRVEWRNVHHYGAEIGGLRYSGEIVHKLSNNASPYRGAHPGQWPFYVNDDDRSHIYFYDRHGGAWHQLDWEHRAALEAPFSKEALEHARKLAKAEDKFVDDRIALAQLLDRWNVGLAASPKDRRMALRQLAQTQPETTTGPSATESTYMDKVENYMDKVEKMMDSSANDYQMPDETETVDAVYDLDSDGGDYYGEAFGDAR